MSLLFVINLGSPRSKNQLDISEGSRVCGQIVSLEKVRGRSWKQELAKDGKASKQRDPQASTILRMVVGC